MFFFVKSAYSADFSFGMGKQYAVIEEFAKSGQILNTEEGFLNAFNASLNQSINQSWAVQGHFALMNGVVSYDGQLQNGQPYLSDTSTRFESIRAQVIFNPNLDSQYFGKNTSLSFFYQLNSRDRLIKSTGGVEALEEKYRWKGVGAAVKYDFPNHPWAVTAKAFKSFSGTLDVMTETLGRGKIALPSGKGFGGKLSWSVGQFYDLDWYVNASYRYHWVPRSSKSALILNGSETAKISEPEHQYQMLGVSLQMLW